MTNLTFGLQSALRMASNLFSNWQNFQMGLLIKSMYIYKYLKM